MAFTPRPNSSKRQREADQKDRVAEKAARREERKARAADRKAAGITGPPMGEPEPPLGEEGGETAAADVQIAPAPRSATPPPGGNRIYVGNLSYNTDAEALRELFSSKGTVTDVHVAMDRDSGRPRGFAFVTMSTSSEARKAIADLDGATFDDRQLRVNAAEDRQSGGRGGGGGGGRRRF
jgi:RNA recognition motif-containing protein